MTTTRTDQAAFLRHRWETPMTTTPPPEGTTEPCEDIERACAWCDYRKDYGVSADEYIRNAEHRAFVAGWEAARGTLDVGGPLR